MNTRAEYIQGLRDLTDFLESHEDAPAPSYSPFNMVVLADTKDELLDLRRRVAAGEKRFDGSYFRFSRRFGPHSIMLVIKREQICKRVVTTTILPATDEIVLAAKPERETEVISWECPDSVLEPDHAAEKATTQE